jgi:hypothetical protein
MFFANIRKLTSRFSLRLRLTVVYVIVFGITTAIFNGIIFNSTMNALQGDFDDALFNYAVDVSASIDIGPRGDLTFPPLRVDDGKILPFALGTALIQVRHISGKILTRVGDFGEWDPPFHRDFQKLVNGEEASYRTIPNVELIPNAEADSYRLIGFPLDSATTPQLILQIAVPMSLLETQVKSRLALFQLGLPAVLLISILGGLLVSSRALAPVTRMIETAKSIDANELDQRVPVPAANDEIKRLALTLNEMLARIEEAFRSQERFVSDASHQLLTPLTIIQSELEMLSKGPRSEQEIEAFLESTQQEINALSRIVQDMLLLARVDAGLGALNLQTLNLDEVVTDALVRCEKAAKKNAIRLVFDLTGDAEFRGPVRADPDLLENLFINLIENAIKYSPRGQVVRIELKWSKDDIDVFVEDHGVGVPPSDMPFIFERFRRAHGADRQAPGFGLGLAISRKIAQLHQAELTAENRPEGGARFHLKMKKI